MLYTSAIHILQYGRGVAGRLGVAYRRHADVRRSANDWSIATRDDSLRERAFRPVFPSVTRSSHIRAQFTYAYACAGRTYADPRRTTPPDRRRVGGSSLREKPFSLSQPIALRLCLRGSSRVDLFTSPCAHFLKNGGSL